MVRRRAGFLLVCGVGLLLGCETSPTAPGPLASISIGDRAIHTIEPGQNLVLTAVGRDAGGTETSDELGVTWRTSHPDRVVVHGGGVVSSLGPLGLAWVVAEVGAFRDSVGVWVQRPEAEPSTFEISLAPSGDVPGWMLEALQRAAERWEEVIRAPLPAVEPASLVNHCSGVLDPTLLEGVESGVRIEVTVSDSFPSGTYVEAVGGPCIHRGLPHPTTVVGEIVLNADHLEAGIDSARLTYLAHHEMGHALGLVGLVQGFQPDWLDPVEAVYTGPLALWGYYLDRTRLVSELSFASGNHWSFPDVMGSTASNEIKNVTVGALMDLGYPAAWYGSGIYGPLIR